MISMEENMKSEIVGAMEKMVQPLIQKFASPAMVDVTITLQPDAAMATAKTIELLAQTIDVQTAMIEDRQKKTKEMAFIMLWCGFLALLGYLDVPVPF